MNDEGLQCANIWSGWAVPPSGGVATEEDVAPVLDYLRDVVCRSDPKLFEWVLMWIADIFQNPSQKPGTMVVLVGEQGAGKSVLCEDILRPIIGSAHFTKVGTIEKLTSKFNAHMSGKLVIQGEEVLNSNRRTDNEALKDMITSRKRSIELKGRDVFESTDHGRYILTSNNIDNAVAVGGGDRRTTICHVWDRYAYKGGRNEEQRLPYWNRLFGWLRRKGEDGNEEPHKENLAKLHQYFLSVPIVKDRIRVSHETAAKRATRLNSSRGIDKWLLSMLEMSNPFDSMREADRGYSHSFVYATNKFVHTDDWPEYVTYALLEQSLRTFASRDQHEQKSAQQIAAFFKENGLLRDTVDCQVRHNGQRIRVRPFPTRMAITEYLERTGIDVLQTQEDAPLDSDEGPAF
jgi:hypothetical protein